MPDLPVKSKTRLDRFLLENRVMQWRISVLIANGGVKLLDGKTKRELPLKGPGTPIGSGDIVRLVTPLPKPCADALQHEASTNCRDYAIVPGATEPQDRKKPRYKPSFDDLMESYIKARPLTILVNNRALKTLDGFLGGIATSDEFTHPIRHLIIVGHASAGGAFRISIGAGTAVESGVSYEALEEAVAKGYLVIDMRLLEPRPAGVGPAQLRLLGCSVGAQAPYMKKFKEALGSKIVLIAPKFLAMPDRIQSPSGPTIYLGYEFTVRSPAPVKDRKTLIRLYDAKSTAAEKNKDPTFTLRSGKRVPIKSWDDWVPADINRHTYSVLGKKLPIEPPVLSTPVTLPVLKVRAVAHRRFLVNEKFPFFLDPFKGADTRSIPLAKNTGKAEDWKKEVRKFLEQPMKHPTLPGKMVKLFDPSHPLPFYVRTGYATMDEFMDGWDWRFTYDDAKKMLSFSPVRHEYRIWQPITSEPGNELILNYYPTGTIPKRFATLLPVKMLRVDDPYFFGRY